MTELKHRSGTEAAKDAFRDGFLEIYNIYYILVLFFSIDFFSLDFSLHFFFSSVHEGYVASKLNRDGEQKLCFKKKKN